MSDWNPEHMPAFDDDGLCWRPPEANEWQALREDSEELARRADRIRALEAENARLRDALGEAVKYVEWVRECDSANGHGGDVWLADDLLTRLRAAL